MASDPDLRFFGFSLWVDGREFPDASDYWDSNWLMIRAQMVASGARVEAAGPILMTTDIEQFRNQTAAMMDSLKGEAALRGLEPGVDLVLRMQKLGHIEGVIKITPDHLNQHHRFIVYADQTYLPALVSSCDAILDQFPVINAEEWNEPSGRGGFA